MPRARLITLPVAALTLAGCGSEQDALHAHSRAARGITSLWWNMLIGCGLALAIVGLVLFLAWARRRQPGIPGVRDAERASWAVVIGLGLIVPVLALTALFLFSDIFLIRETALPPASAADRPQLTIHVIGHQFWWEARYPGTRAVTANEIHIPARTNVQVLLSTDDVIHSFWVPELNKKVDMLPEQTNRVLLYADKPGRYRGQCAEFCGLQHAHMGLYVFAQPRAAFNRWRAQQSRPAPAAGSSLFVEKCGACHTIRGTDASGTAGPDLTHVGSRTSLAALTIPNTRERMREWISDPQKLKPGSLMPRVNLSPAQIDRLVSYLEARK